MGDDAKSFNLPCGGTALFDHSSGVSYRCDTCFMVVGSMGMPRDCKEHFEAGRAALREREE
jgi:hypothetical protein